MKKRRDKKVNSNTFLCMTTQQLLPPPHLLPTCLHTPEHAFLDWWVDHYVEIDTRVKTRLTGGGSLYQAYVDACQEQRLIPVSLRAFTKRFETLLEFKLKIPSTKARDQRGTFFRAIKLKDAPSSLLHSGNKD